MSDFPEGSRKALQAALLVINASTILGIVVLTGITVLEEHTRRRTTATVCKSIAHVVTAFQKSLHPKKDAYLRLVRDASRDSWPNVTADAFAQATATCLEGRHPVSGGQLTHTAAAIDALFVILRATDCAAPGQLSFGQIEAFVSLTPGQEHHQHMATVVERSITAAKENGHGFSPGIAAVAKQTMVTAKETRLESSHRMKAGSKWGKVRRRVLQRSANQDQATAILKSDNLKGECQELCGEMQHSLNATAMRQWISVRVGNSTSDSAVQGAVQCHWLYRPWP